MSVRILPALLLLLAFVFGFVHAAVTTEPRSFDVCAHPCDDSRD